MKSLISLCMFIAICSTSFALPFSLITDSYASSDHSVSLPTFNGERTLLKAIVRSVNLSGEGVVAVPEASAMIVIEGCAGGINGKVEFRHDGSVCNNPERQIIDYQWIFELTGDESSAFNAYDWGGIPSGEFSSDGKAWHSSEKDAHVIYTFLSAGEYKVALRVLNDNPGGPETDIGTLTITVTESPNYPPVVDAAGTYTIIEGDDLILEGEVTDINEPCGDVVTSSWDLDNDGAYDDYLEAGGTVAWSVIESLGLAVNVAHDITLRAVDEYAETAYDASTLTITIATGADKVYDYKGAALYPNPVVDILNIRPDNEITGDLEIRIMDNEGKVMIEKRKSGDRATIRINVSMLSSGIYYVQISSPGYIRRLSFIKI